MQPLTKDQAKRAKEAFRQEIYKRTADGGDFLACVVRANNAQWDAITAADGEVQAETDKDRAGKRAAWASRNAYG